MTDYAGQIKELVTMPEMLERYGIADSGATRIPCPIHHGTDKNLSVYKNGFRCWVCGEHGTVIDFVMTYFGLSFREALAKINEDFNLSLPIGRELTKEERAEADRIAYRIRQERESKKRERQAVQKRYEDALDRWVYLDTMKQNNAPQGGTEPLSDSYVMACREIDQAAYELEQAEIALYRYKHSGGEST